MRLDLIKRLEECQNVAGVGFLRGRHAALIHPVVYLVVVPLVRLVDLLPERLWIQRDVSIFFINDVVKLVRN